MPAGFQVAGSHGVLQIDSDQVNMTLRQTGIAQVTDTAPATLSFAGMESPMLCIRSLGADPVAVATSGSLDAPTYTLWANYGVATAVQWYLFDATPNVPSNGGLTIYRPDGRVAFSSDQPLMKVVGVFGLPTAGSRQASGVTYGTSAPLVAACIGSPRLWVDNVDMNMPVGVIVRALYADGVRTSGGQVSAIPTMVTNQRDWTWSGSYKVNGGPLIAVDVTGL